jgi:ABC-type oligopeptide transport system substrate-binding subunit
MRKIKPNKTKMEANMKKFIILLLSIFLAMSLAACGNKTDSRDSSGKTEIKDAKELLTTVWNSYEEDEKFAIAGGDMTEENMTEDAPGTFGITDADELDRMLGFPAADAESGMPINCPQFKIRFVTTSSAWDGSGIPLG